MFSWLFPAHWSLRNKDKKNTLYGVDIRKYMFMGKEKISFNEPGNPDKITRSAFIFYFFNRDDENDRIAKLVELNTATSRVYSFVNHGRYMVNAKTWESGVIPLWHISMDSMSFEFEDYIFRKYGHTYDYKNQRWLEGMPVNPKYLEALNDQKETNIRIGNKKKIINRVNNENNDSNVIKVDFKTKVILNDE